MFIETRVQHQLELLFQEPPAPPETGFYCAHCAGAIRVGDLCVLDIQRGSLDMAVQYIHARCYTDWWILERGDRF